MIIFRVKLRAMIEEAEREFDRMLAEAKVVVSGSFHSSRLTVALINVNRAEQVLLTLKSVWIEAVGLAWPPED